MTTDPAPSPAASDPFDTLRPRLFSVAYRMLGTRADAEDIVQDAWLRWQQNTDRSAVQSAEAWLVTIVTRLSIASTGSSNPQWHLRPTANASSGFTRSATQTSSRTFRNRSRNEGGVGRDRRAKTAPPPSTFGRTAARRPAQAH